MERVSVRARLAPDHVVHPVVPQHGVADPRNHLPTRPPEVNFCRPHVRAEHHVVTIPPAGRRIGASVIGQQVVEGDRRPIPGVHITVRVIGGEHDAGVVEHSVHASPGLEDVTEAPIHPAQRVERAVGTVFVTLEVVVSEVGDRKVR